MPAVACPSCRHELRVPGSLAGGRVTCPACGEIVAVPGRPSLLPEDVAGGPPPEASPGGDAQEIPPAARLGGAALALCLGSGLIFSHPAVGYAAIPLGVG